MDSRAGLADLVEGVRRRWFVALLVALPLLLGVVLYSQSLPTTYTSTAVVALTPRAQADIGGDVVRVVLPKYVAYVTSRPTSDTVAERLGLDAGDLRAGTDASVAPETANLEITVELESALDAALAAAELSKVAVDLSTVDSLLEAVVIVPAVPVDEPSGPPRTLLQAAGLLLALLAGLCAALAVEHSRPRVVTADELSRATGHRTLGRLPSLRVLRKRPELALGDQAVSAAVGSLRVQIDSESRLQPLRTLAVVSPSGGDGKTTVAAALAQAMGQLDLRVLLVDADLRRPRLADHLGVEVQGRGLLGVLEGSQDLAGSVQPSPAGGSLDLLLTRSSADASTLLALRLDEVVAKLRDEYDLVVVDCPPVLVADDSLMITQACDATVLVVASGSSRTSVAAAARALDSLRVRTIGCVLNKASGRGDGAFGYGSYGADD